MTDFESGDLPVLKYLVRSDNSDFILGSPFDNGVLVTYTKIIQTGNQGKIYRFRVAAQNVLGTGPYSDEIQLMATNAPDAPTLTPDENSRTLTSILLRFAPGTDNGGSDIVGYELWRDEGIMGSHLSITYDGLSRPEII